MDGYCGNVTAFGKCFIPSLIGFNSLTIPSFKSFCMSVTGLKSFESSYCVLKSPTRYDKKFCWMFCRILRNSLTIQSLFLGSVIFRNDVFFSYLFYFSNMVLNTALNMVLTTVSNTVSNTNSSRNTNLISTKQFISFIFYITSFFKVRFRFFSKIFFHSCKRFKLQ